MAASVSLWTTIGSLELYPDLEDMGESAGATAVASALEDEGSEVHLLEPQWQWILKGPVIQLVLRLGYCNWHPRKSCSRKKRAAGRAGDDVDLVLGCCGRVSHIFHCSSVS